MGLKTSLGANTNSTQIQQSTKLIFLVHQSLPSPVSSLDRYTRNESSLSCMGILRMLYINCITADRE